MDRTEGLTVAEPGAASYALGAQNLLPSTPKLWRIDCSDAKHMAWLTYAYLGFHLFLWTLLATLSHRAPPWDNIEQLVWMQSLEWGYYKHPPFPTWWVHGWTELLGRSMWVTFFSAQMSVVLMQLFVWRIALLVTSPARAFASVVLSSLLIYHGVHGIMANHNTLQLMPVGLLLWLSLLAVREGQMWRWALVGCAAALCLLSKYSALIWLAILGVWMLQDKRMRSWRAWGGVTLAVAICAILVSPHISWLLHDGSPGLNYASKAIQGQNDPDSIGHWGRLGKFWLIQFARVLPMLLGLGLVNWLLLRANKRDLLAQGGAGVSGALQADGRDQLSASPEWRFVLFMGLGPMLLTTVLGVVGVRLGAAWAATYFVMGGILALVSLPMKPPAATPQFVRSVLWAGIAMELLLAIGMALGSGWLADVAGRAARSNFPAAKLAHQLDEVWDAHGATPMRVVVGETWLAGNVSVRSKYQPLVYIDADAQKSPWIKPHMLEDCGALIVVDRRDMNVPLSPSLQQLVAQAQFTGDVKMHWTRFANSGPELDVMWAILPAHNPAACPR
ncbi:glycosyltransferase family 39 protein [Roseateles koreensis]|uniref:Glycosyltransferase family 39 protein n=1 Tax=Roseateles koreensis TaxID=2987526 RepID=A0ABT5KLE2_9BURK|nr:glycosyltransferase family 39 protein [Roseateles koreensis]MDC8783716.1 glycosyltransferase family 39 protein [Roseateles koreensis]